MVQLVEFYALIDSELYFKTLCLPRMQEDSCQNIGSGKSFAVAQFMLQFCGQNPTPKIVWMDNGESSRNLTEVLDGEFVGLSLDSGICVNMFDLEPGETTPDGSKVRLIIPIPKNNFL